MKRILVTCCLVGLVAMPALAQFSASDFLPPAQAATPEETEQRRQVEDPGAVKEVNDPAFGPVLTGASAHDAANAFVQGRTEGAQIIQVGSGTAFIATGTGTYSDDMQNVVAVRIAKRNAYAKAFMVAKGHLAAQMNGMSLRGVETLTSQLAALDTDADSLVNTEDAQIESLAEVSEALLRGYVLYDVFDDVEGATVYVTILTSPRILGGMQRMPGGGLVATSLAEGMQTVLSEVQNGLVPPVGGRIVSVAGTGELAFVGFGSEVLRPNKSKAVQSRLALEAKKIAAMRARSALLGIIRGDQVQVSSDLDAGTRDSVAQFREATKDEETVPATLAENFEAYEEQRRQFVSLTASSSEYSSVRNGDLPAGVQSRTWVDAKGEFAWAMSVYVPSARAAAEAHAAEMEQASIDRPGSAGGSAPSDATRPVQQGGGFTGQANPNVGQGPSGRMMDDADF